MEMHWQTLFACIPGIFGLPRAHYNPAISPVHMDDASDGFLPLHHIFQVIIDHGTVFGHLGLGTHQGSEVRGDVSRRFMSECGKGHLGQM